MTHAHLLPRGAPWTEAEDAVLRKHYARRRGGAIRCAELLPHRTVCAVRERAKKILPRQRREARWTTAEDRILTLSWGDAPRTLAQKLPGRTWKACLTRAQLLGLPPVSRADGVVSITHAARVCGYDYATLRAILDAEAVTVGRYHGGEGAEGQRICPRYAVDLDEVREAVARYLRRTAHLLTLSQAAQRCGTSRDTVTRALALAGLVTTGEKVPRGLDPAAVDAAWAQWVSRPRTVRCGAQGRAEECAA